MAKQPKDPKANEAKDAGTITRVPEDGVALSEAVIAAIEMGKSPQGQIMVVGPKGGRWRAGRHFTPEPTIIDVEDLTEEDGNALISDPKLIVGPAFPPVPA